MTERKEREIRELRALVEELEEELAREKRASDIESEMLHRARHAAEAECERLRGVIKEAAEILSAALSEKVEG